MSAAVDVASAVEAALKPGMWSKFVSSGFVTGDERLAEIFDLDPHRLKAGVHISELHQSVHRDDLQAVLTSVNRAEQLSGVIFLAYRIRVRGSIRLVQGIGRCTASLDGMGKINTGVIYDITGMLGAGGSRALSDSRLDMLADHCLMAHALAAQEHLEPISQTLRLALEGIGFELARRME